MDFGNAKVHVVGELSDTENDESFNEAKCLCKANSRIQQQEQDARIVSYDEAFNKAGFGLWQWMLLLQCGWANASDAIEIMCISFIITPISDTMNVSYAEVSGLTFSLFSGMMVGGYIWGSMADSRGRRQTVCVSLLVNALFGALSALSQSYWLLVLLRFCSGIGAGGSLPICFAYFGEFQPTKYRGAMISALATCWMVGNLITGLLALCLLPDSATIALLSPYGHQWRLFVILCSIPSLTSAVLFYFLPESPKFLYARQRLDETLAVLRTVHKWNNWRRNRPFGIGKIISGHRFQQDNDEETVNLLQASHGSHFQASTGNGLRISRKTLLTNAAEGFKVWKLQMAQIFAPVRRTHSISLTTLMGLVAFCGYGMAMWTPVLLEKTERYGGSPCRGHTGNDTHADKVPNYSVSVYKDILIGFLAQLPGNFIVIFLMDRIGAKLLLIISSYLSGFSVLFFWLVNSRVSVIAMNGVFNAVSVGLWNSLDVLLVEMYPTSIRSTASGNACGASRLGSILGSAVFGLFMDLNCSVPILSVFVVYIFCGTLSFKLPKTRSMALE